MSSTTLQESAGFALAHVSLDDKYTATSGKIYLSGVQALVRLPLIQRQRDLAVGLNTAGFISGYRDSPLGGLDQTLWKTKKFLESEHIRFVPGVNDTAAVSEQCAGISGPGLACLGYVAFFRLYGRLQRWPIRWSPVLR